MKGPRMRSRIFCCLVLATTLLAACSSSQQGASGGAGGAGTGPGGAGYAGGQVTPGSSEEALVQSVGDRIFFETDHSDLTDTARNTLIRQAQWLQRYPTVDVIVSGNCDARGTEEYNLALGQRRAVTDANFLVAQGISSSRLQALSYGKDRPIDPANTPEAWAKNRNAITQVR
jgi:peptidoglycan-associated lipoprotein